jgi:hypothetical protein
MGGLEVRDRRWRRGDRPDRADEAGRASAPGVSASVYEMSAAVVLKASGSPERLDDVRAFDADMPGGPQIAPASLADPFTRHRLLTIAELTRPFAITEEIHAPERVVA